MASRQSDTTADLDEVLTKLVEISAKIDALTPQPPAPAPTPAP